MVQYIFWTGVLSQSDISDINGNYNRITTVRSVLVKLVRFIDLFSVTKSDVVKKLPFSTKLTLKTIWLNVTREEYFKLCINCNESRNDGCDIYVGLDQFFKGKNPEIIRPLTVMGKNLLLLSFFSDNRIY